MALPEWLDPVLDAARMRAVDEWAISEQGVPGLELMEAAGSALADAVVGLAPAGPIVVVCGKGNNGGDGSVCARHLRRRGLDVEVLLLAGLDELSGDALTNAELLDPPAVEIGGEDQLAAALGGAEIVVDAIFGTGFAGEPRGLPGAAIDAINDLGARVVAADIPSGVSADDGTAAGAAVGAGRTVTFHAAKVGHWVAPGKALRGELSVAPIGIPPGAPAMSGFGLVSDRALELIGRRDAGSNKFSAGSVAVIGGSRGLTGAVCLAAQGAARAGAGYVTCAVPASLEPIFEQKLTEQMTVGLADADGSLTAEGADPALELARSRSAVLLGSGIGRTDGVFELCRTLARACEQPLVIDADGLRAFAAAAEGAGTEPDQCEVLRARSAPTVLTPHSGEAAALLGRDRAEVEAARLASATELAERTGAIVALKGDDTIVSDGAIIAISRGGAPALATAGTGDVLAGMIAALIARGADPFAATCAAVHAHVRAGREAEARLGSADGVLAGDLLELIPASLLGATP